ncbi:TetR/AcrR family transcriptional regulator [Paludibacter sp.]
MGIEKVDTTTEEKIKEAAKTIFHKKGFAATRTRDIAEEANINLALLNYYFRSKKRLFEIIMLETISNFVHSMAETMNNQNTSLEDKITIMTSNYIDFIIKEPNIPIFMLNEIRNNSDEIINRLSVMDLIVDSEFFKQFQEAVSSGKISQPNPFHFLMNLWSLIIFPFLGKPLLVGLSNMSDKEFNLLMLERKSLIPLWIDTLLKTT